MTQRIQTKLFDDVVSITNEYFGVAADRFVARQIRNHLHKDPEQLCKEDLTALIKWISLAMALLTEDEALVKKYSASLRAMASESQ